MRNTKRWRTAGYPLAGLLVALLAACGGGGDDGSGGAGTDSGTGGGNGGGSTAPPAAYTIGGTVSGLAGNLVLQNNGAGNLDISANGPFVFAATVAAGGSYAVTVLTQPEGQECVAAAASGTASSNVTGVTVTCTDSVLTALPELLINTEGGVAITSKEDYVNATLQLKSESGAVLLDNAALEIRGRGNSTWNYPKKPYRLKLGSKAALLGMPSSKHWVLLADYLDKTLLRNEIAFEFSRLVGMEYTTRSRAVVVRLNGSYDGIYHLVEQIRVDPDRVNIPELKAEDGADATLVTGGYLMEVDSWKGEDYCRNTPHAVALCFNTPETLLETEWAAHKAYIDGFIDEMEAALYGTGFADPVNGYARYIDVDSAVNWYLVNELGKNVDSNFWSSVFVYKKRGGKLTFGPVWDFDIAFGNAQWAQFGFFDGSDPTGWWTRTVDSRMTSVDPPAAPMRGNWLARMFQDPAFQARVETRWNDLREAGAIDELVAFIDRRAADLGQVQQANFARWNVLNTVLQPDMSPVTGPYPNHVAALKAWLQQRVEWMDREMR